MQAVGPFFVKIKNSTTFNFGADLMRNGIPWCPRYPVGKNLKDSFDKVRDKNETFNVSLKFF